MSIEELLGAPVRNLRVEDIDALLAGQVDETLYWEAKADGREPLHAHDIRKAVCGFSNTLEGGYVLVGVARTPDGTWQMLGLTHALGNEIGAWLHELIMTGIRSNPRCEIQPLVVDGRQAAVIWVRPVNVELRRATGRGVWEPD